MKDFFGNIEKLIKSNKRKIICFVFVTIVVCSAICTISENMIRNKTYKELNKIGITSFDDLVTKKEDFLALKKEDCSLNDKELLEVDKALEIFENINKIETYKKESIFYNIEGDVYTRRLTYTIDLDKDSIDYSDRRKVLDSVSENYINKIDNLVTLPGYEDNFKYIKELISASKIDSTEKIEKDDTFYVYIKGPLKTSVNDLSNVLINRIEKFAIKEKPKFSLILADISDTYEFDNFLNVLKSNVRVKNNEYNREIKKYYKSFSAPQSFLYYSKIKENYPESKITFADVIENNNSFKSEVYVLNEPHLMNVFNSVIKNIIYSIIVCVVSIKCSFYLFSQNKRYFNKEKKYKID